MISIKSLYKNIKKYYLQNLFSQEWETIILGEISDICTGNKDLKDSVDDGKYPFFVRSENIERINTYSYDGEAILIPGDGNVGKVYHYINGKFDYHQRVYKISNFDGCIGKYIYYYLEEFFYKEAKKNSLKATVNSLRLPTIKNMKIKLPSIDKQKTIAKLLTLLDNKIYLEKYEIKNFRKLKKGLLQKMFC